jgi:hypothetical protein
VPGEVAVKRRAPVVAGQPRFEECDRRVGVEGLEVDVDEVVARVGVAGILYRGGLDGRGLDGRTGGLEDADRGGGRKC